MLTIFGRSQRFCDRVPRRSFLQIGALGLGAGALTLSDVFRHDAIAAASGAGQTPKRHKAVIHIFLGGGPPHQDMWEIKTEAPKEIRGEFKPIDTKVPGIQIGEVFTRIASIMDKCVVIRSLVGAKDRHAPEQCHSGWENNSLSSVGGRPSLGAVLTRLQGPVDPSVPPFVGLARPTKHTPWADPGGPGFLGSAYGCFKPDGPGLANMKLNGITLDRLADRKQLLASFDNLRRDIDASGSFQGVDSFTERAFGVLTSSKLLEALDLSKESDKVRERYGDGKPYKYQL